MAQRVLIVEDEQHIAEGLRFNLESEGYEVRTVESGEEAITLLLGDAREPFDVIVLDVMLPGVDGFTVISELRRAGQFIPTLMLTARGRPEDVLKGFEAGADDYLPKPFELSILIARIGGLLRRKQWFKESVSPSLPLSLPHNETYAFNGKSIDFGLLALNAHGKSYPLTAMEATILRYLIQNEGQTISRKTLLQDVWGLHEDTDTRAIDNFIVRLRRYLEADPSQPRHLITVRGVGYRFVASPQT